MQESDVIDLKRLYLILRRQIWVILLFVILFGGAAAAYVMTATPQYTAKTKILLDKSFTGAVSDISSKRMAFDPAAIESEVEVLRSRRVTEVVIKNLMLKGFFPELKKDPGMIDQAVEYLQKDLIVRRLGETYVLSIQYTSDDPVVAADIANAYAEAYINDQLEALSETSNRTYRWLQEKTQQMKDQLVLAQSKVTNYRIQYNKQKQQERLGLTISPQSSEKVYTLSELKGLEKEVMSLEGLFDSYLEKLEELNLQQSFPVTETRIITLATPPLGKSHPKSTLILGAAIILGGGLGVLIALIRDNFDKALKRAGQVKREIGTSFLGFFPKSGKKHRRLIEFITPQGEECAIEMYAQSVTSNFSLHAETIRAVKNAIDSKREEDKRNKVIGVISAFPEEGAHIIGSNLALSAAYAGNTTLYVDGDIRVSTLIKTKKKDIAIDGLAGVFVDHKSVEDVALTGKDINLSFLPSLAFEADQLLPAVDHKAVKDLFEQSKEHYDYVFVDIPPLIASADAYNFAQAVDLFVVVSAWGKTLPNELNFYLQQNKIPQDKIIGLVLNSANMSKLKRLYGHRAYSK